jgi:hypothetical protein
MRRCPGPFFAGLEKRGRGAHGPPMWGGEGDRARSNFSKNIENCIMTIPGLPARAVGLLGHGKPTLAAAALFLAKKQSAW